MKTSEVLRKAADEIRRRGWCQGSYGADSEDPANCAVCSVGAVIAAQAGHPWGSVVSAARRDVINRLDRAVARSIVGWNDKPGRTVEEVLDAFERAAQAAESDGD